MLFFGYFEAISTDKQIKNDHEKEIIAYTVSMIMKAALLAAAWAGKSRKYGLESITKLSIEEKDK